MMLQVTYNLYKLRMRAGLTQQQLANRSGVGRSTISDIEVKGTHPTVYTICLLAFALNVKLDKLINVRLKKDKKN